MAKSKFKLSDINNLDFNNTAGWPQEAKIGAGVLAVLLVAVLGWYLVIRDKQTTLEGLEAEEVTLRGDFEKEAAKAANLEPLKAQLEQMEQMLKQMLRQLPSKTEMPDLIVDISQTARATGINNELFQPGAEVLKDFYAEQPITLEMNGTYHQFGQFVSGVASLPRVVIMTFHDISLAPKESAAGAPALPPGTLGLKGTIKTYRYLDENELEEQAKGQTNAAQGGAATPAAAAAGGAP
ncbi:type 4a pilus biogenesis protein PilO [Silanimonas sp.]|jgi:type IV pilus assembly protein PilO|uniref:type 4a pilus biogenesis protein PilO n=1 Tax=Silanimonas sp. TaxID=1929290 RepID=UPI0022C6F5BF|nr:type 4a pilus biogenesis protein PilO [Silanimonas sp.]MCZ8064095.1 type 4a pilus biogenesis protein PilO [Silanimonas sp.]